MDRIGPKKKPDWQIIEDRLKAEGWRLQQERRFQPMLGAYWVIKAVQPDLGEWFVTHGPTLKIAFKKMETSIRKGLRAQID